MGGGRKERRKNLVGEERRKRERNRADYVRSVLAELLLLERKQKQVLSKEMYMYQNKKTLQTVTHTNRILWHIKN